MEFVPSLSSLSVLTLMSSDKLLSRVDVRVKNSLKEFLYFFFYKNVFGHFFFNLENSLVPD